MASRREIVLVGINIICEHLMSVLLQLKRQRQRQLMRRRIRKRKNLDKYEDDLHPSWRFKPNLDKQNDCSIMGLPSSTQMEYGDLTTSEVSMKDENPQTVTTTMHDINIKREIKQEIDDIPESLCSIGTSNCSFVNQAHNTPEDVQQFATLCEVYMPPSPSSSN